MIQVILVLFSSTWIWFKGSWAKAGCLKSTARYGQVMADSSLCHKGNLQGMRTLKVDPPLPRLFPAWSRKEATASRSLPVFQPGLCCRSSVRQTSSPLTSHSRSSWLGLPMPVGSMFQPHNVFPACVPPRKPYCGWRIARGATLAAIGGRRYPHLEYLREAPLPVARATGRKEALGVDEQCAVVTGI